MEPRPHLLVQRWNLMWTLGCEKILPGAAWLLLSKTGPPFSPSLGLQDAFHRHR